MAWAGECHVTIGEQQESSRKWAPIRATAKAWNERGALALSGMVGKAGYTLSKLRRGAIGERQGGGVQLGRRASQVHARRIKRRHEASLRAKVNANF